MNIWDNYFSHQIQAEIVAGSVSRLERFRLTRGAFPRTLNSPQGNYCSLFRKYETGLVTFRLKYPDIIHPEVMSYTTAARNVSSRRAIPVATILKQVKENPYIPVVWFKNCKGMEGKEIITDENEINRLRAQCLELSQQAVRTVESMSEVHKQHANRYIQPWLIDDTTFTMTFKDLENFIGQRRHHSAQPEIQLLADQMLIALSQFNNWKQITNGPIKTVSINSFKDMKKFNKYGSGSFHLPFTNTDNDSLSTQDFIIQSVARCARASYRTFDSPVNSSLDSDYDLVQRLLHPGGIDSNEPKHMSPFEHVCYYNSSAKCSSKFGVGGFHPIRRLFTDETVQNYDLFQLDPLHRGLNANNSYY